MASHAGKTRGTGSARFSSGSHPAPAKATMLPIETFANNRGGNVLYKALAHPLAAERAASLVRVLERSGPVALYDPDGVIGSFDAFYGLGNVKIAGYFVQKVEALGKSFRGSEAQPVSRLIKSGWDTLFVASFEPER